jgi:hypothetical protein
VRLHVRVLGTEQLLAPVDGEALDDVDVLTTAVIPLARITLCVFVRQDRAGRLKHGNRHEVLTGNQLEPIVLPFRFAQNGIVDIRISIAQQPLVWHDPPANRAHFASVLAPLAGTTDLVILPEMFTTGFTMTPDRYAEPADGATRAWLLEQARVLDAAVGGSVAVNDAGRYYNRFMLALPGGPTYWYDKRHLFRMGGEHRHYDAGDHALIVEWRGARLCPLVCYDLRFPVWSRRRPGLDYYLVIYSANWPAAPR